MSNDQNRDETIRVTLDAMKRAYQNASKEWLAVAAGCVYCVGKTKKLFTTDDVHLLLDKEEAKTHNTSALGPVMKNAQKAGWIEKTEFKVRSKRVSGHGVYRPIWRSLIYESPQPESSTALREQRAQQMPLPLRGSAPRSEARA